MSKKVIVVGGGIAGLSAGIYAKRCGFDVTILESHSILGGNCTSWKRSGYLFEGGMHWLAGSNPKTALHKLWRCVGALDDSVKIHYPEPFMEFRHEDTPIRFYRDVDETERHWLSLSPADAKEIRKFCQNVRKVRNLTSPIPELRGVKATNKTHPPISMIFSALSGLRVFKTYASVTREEYINRFKHPGLRELMGSVIYENMGVAPIFFTLGSLSNGDGGFPEGGSLPFANRMVKTFVGLGGEILRNTAAEKVIVNGNKISGVMVKGEMMNADAVIVTSDTMAADRLFDIPLESKWLDEMRATTSPTMAVFVCLGIDADLRSYPTHGIYKVKKQLKLATQTYDYLSASNYAHDPVYSPAGKTAMTIQLPGDTYDYWKKAREEGRYDEEKQKIGEEVIAALAESIPEIKGKVEVCDIATPLTYERYCGNWKGSWMTDMTKEMKMKTYPADMKGLKGVYFAGHRMMPPGGIPVALMSGRTAVQYLCRDTDTLFVSE